MSSNKPPSNNSSFSQELRSQLHEAQQQQEEDGRSWQEIYDENTVLRDLVRKAQAAAASSSSKQQNENNRGDSGVATPMIVSDSNQVLQLRTELLTATRLATHVEEMCSAMSVALSDAVSALKQHLPSISTSRSGGGNGVSDASRNVEKPAVAAPAPSLTSSFTAQLEHRFRDAAAPPAPLTALAASVDESLSLLRFDLCGFAKQELEAREASKQECRQLIEQETSSLQQVISELSGRLYQAQLTLKEAEVAAAAEQQRNKETTKEKHMHSAALQEKLEEMGFEIRHKEKMSTLLREQLARSQKQLEQMTQEFQRSALMRTNGNNNNGCIGGSSNTSAGVAAPTTATTPVVVTRPRSNSQLAVSAFAPLDPGRTAMASLAAASSASSLGNSNNSRNTSGAFGTALSAPLFYNDSQKASPLSGSSGPLRPHDAIMSGEGAASASASISVDVLRQENHSLIHRVAGQQEKIWALENVKKSYEEQMEDMSKRIVLQGAAIRHACGVYTNLQQQKMASLPTSTSGAAPTLTTTTATTTSSGGFFTRSRANSAAVTSGGGSSKAPPLGSGGIPVEIVHATHLQTALEEALAKAAEYKQALEGQRAEST